MIKRDYIMRLVDELAQTVTRALSSSSEQDLELVEAELDEAEQALGILRGAEALSASSLAVLLGGDKCVLYAELLLGRAAVLERRGGASQGVAQRQRARDLLRSSRPEQLGDLKATLLEQAEANSRLNADPLGQLK